jgi:hypothetical protein
MVETGALERGDSSRSTRLCNAPETPVEHPDAREFFGDERRGRVSPGFAKGLRTACLAADEGGGSQVNKRQPHTAYLFDIDGVLTNPESKRVEQAEMLAQLVKRLERLEPVGVNTGRSLDFIMEQVLDPIESRIIDKKLVRHFFAIGEKGGACIVYNEDNQSIMQVDNSISVPEIIRAEVKFIVSQEKYSDTMFYDDTKKTMVSGRIAPTREHEGEIFW